MTVPLTDWHETASFRAFHLEVISLGDCRDIELVCDYEDGRLRRPLPSRGILLLTRSELPDRARRVRFLLIADPATATRLELRWSIDPECDRRARP